MEDSDKEFYITQNMFISSSKITASGVVSSDDVDIEERFDHDRFLGDVVMSSEVCSFSYALYRRMGGIVAFRCD